MWGATRPLWPWWPCSWKASRGRPRSLPPRRGEVYGIRVSLWHQRLCTQAKCRKATLKERCMIWKGRVCPVKILECNITQRPIHIWLQVTIYWYIHTVYTCDNIVSYYLFVYMIFMCSNKLDYSIAFGKPAGHRGVAPRGLMCILGGSPRESRREKKEKKKNKKNKKRRRRQSRKTEAACVARFAATTYWPYTKLVQ